MKIYLCARYGRREELAAYARDLGALGHSITSRWVFTDDRKDNGIDLHDHLSMEARAIEDLKDIERADILIAFTEAVGSPYSRGGRHVEFGFALGTGKKLLCVGGAENIFHSGGKMYHAPDFDTAKQVLLRIQDRHPY